MTISIEDIELRRNCEHRGAYPRAMRSPPARSAAELIDVTGSGADRKVISPGLNQCLSRMAG